MTSLSEISLAPGLVIRITPTLMNENCMEIIKHIYLLERSGQDAETRVSGHLKNHVRIYVM